VESISTKTTLLSGVDEGALETVVKNTDDLGNVETKLVDENHVLASEVAVADGGVIGARNDDCASVEELADGVVLDALDGLSVNVAGGAGLDDDVVGDDVLEKSRVLDQTHTVADTIGTAVTDGVTNGFPAGCFATVKSAVDKLGTHDVKGSAVELAAETVLGTSKIEAADTLVTVSPGDLGDILGDVGRKLTHGANNDVHGDGEVITSKSKTLTDGLHDTTKAETLVDVKDGAETDLQVANTIIPAVLTNLVHNTSKSIRTLKNLQCDIKTTEVFHKRRAAVTNTDKLLQFGLIKSGQFNALLFGKLDNGAWTYATIQVFVKLRLGKLLHNFTSNHSLG